ncbi:MAG: patatin family protein [Myxococcota bacterium]|nr:patatin family protein [Myxococcota bacterium]
MVDARPGADQDVAVPQPQPSSALPPERVALVVEGGAMRGIFGAGVLDVFLEQRFRPFDMALGVSVGASNMLSYLAGQHGRARRCFLGQMSQPEFIDGWRILRGGHWMDLDWLWDAITRDDPLDCSAAATSGIEYALVATCARTGSARYLSPNAGDMLQALKASCALPVLYRSTIQLGDEELVDGGISDPLPVREAYRRGARTMVVIRSRAVNFVKRDRLVNRVGSWTIRGTPALARACLNVARVYRDGVAFLRSPPSDCRVLQVAPSTALATGRTSRDRESLDRDYAVGRALGREAILRFERLAGKPALPMVG